MKIAILLLVLLNALFWSWSHWVAGTPHEQQVVTPEPDAEPLVLFAEKYPRRAAEEAAAAAAAQAGAESPDAAEELDASSVAFDPVAPGETIDAPLPAPEPAPPADDEAAKALIDEALAASADAEATPAPLLAMREDGPAEARCVKLGPFLTLREATGAADAMREADLAPTQRLEEAQVWVGHWVHLAPYPTRAEAIAVVEKLRADGVSDIYIEPSGEMRNAISLGLFSDAERAEIRAGSVRRLGVKPQIRDRFRDGSVYWVDVELPPGRDLDPARFGSAQNPRIELVERPCAGAG